MEFRWTVKKLDPNRLIWEEETETWFQINNTLIDGSNNVYLYQEDCKSKSILVFHRDYREEAKTFDGKDVRVVSVESIRVDMRYKTFQKYKTQGVNGTAYPRLVLQGRYKSEVVRYYRGVYNGKIQFEDPFAEPHETKNFKSHPIYLHFVHFADFMSWRHILLVPKDSRSELTFPPDFPRDFVCFQYLDTPFAGKIEGIFYFQNVYKLVVETFGNNRNGKKEKTKIELFLDYGCMQVGVPIWERVATIKLDEETK